MVIRPWAAVAAAEEQMAISPYGELQECHRPLAMAVQVKMSQSPAKPETLVLFLLAAEGVSDCRPRSEPLALPARAFAVKHDSHGGKHGKDIRNH